VVTSATELGNTRPPATIPEVAAKIHEVSFFCLNSSTWDDALNLSEPPPSPDAIDPTFIRDSYGQTPNTQMFEHPCAPLTKILASGTFYYAVESQWDLSSRMCARLKMRHQEMDEAATFDERFVWNEYIVRSLLDFRDRLDVQERQDFDRCQFIVRFYSVL
jgi:synaptojanin